jgi:hypothetical protein
LTFGRTSSASESPRSKRAAGPAASITINEPEYPLRSHHKARQRGSINTAAPAINHELFGLSNAVALDQQLSLKMASSSTRSISAATMRSRAIRIPSATLRIAPSFGGVWALDGVNQDGR